MSAVTAYTIVLDTDNERLIAKVNDHIKAGWEPIGGVSVVQYPHSPVLLQAMIGRAN